MSKRQNGGRSLGQPFTYDTILWYNNSLLSLSDTTSALCAGIATYHRMPSNTTWSPPVTSFRAPNVAKRSHANDI